MKFIYSPGHSKRAMNNIPRYTLQSRNTVTLPETSTVQDQKLTFCLLLLEPPLTSLTGDTLFRLLDFLIGALENPFTVNWINIELDDKEPWSITFNKLHNPLKPIKYYTLNFKYTYTKIQITWLQFKFHKTLQNSNSRTQNQPPITETQTQNHNPHQKRFEKIWKLTATHKTPNPKTRQNPQHYHFKP